MADSNYSSPTITGTKTTTISVFTTRNTVTLAFGFTTVFVVGFTALLLLNPSSYYYSSPRLKSFLQTSSYRSHFSSIFSHFLPNSSQSSNEPVPVSQFHDNPFQISPKSEDFHGKKDWSLSSDSDNGSPSLISPEIERFGGKDGSSSENNSGGSKIDSNGNAFNTPNVTFSQEFNQTSKCSNLNETNCPGSSSPPLEFRESGKEFKEGIVEKMVSSNVTLNGSSDEILEKQRKGDVVETMSHCRVFDGKWVRDDSYPLYAPGSCPHIDESFNCFLNGRPDRGYEKYRWQPNECIMPRLNGKHMLELLKGKRVVFVGDSLGRNMWESLVCILKNSVEEKSNVFEVSGRQELGKEGSYSILFEGYNCSIEYIRSPFLVREWQMIEGNGSKKETLRLDMIDKSSDKYKDADVLIFNTGHWWTHDKTSKGKGYYQEGNTIYDQLNVKVAFRKALTTWARWIDTNIDSKKTLVFFRGFSASHFRGGRWNSGGQCDGETEPISNEKYLKKYPSKMRIFESVVNGMNTPVLYLNISRMTGFRKDGHPSIYRKQNLTEEERSSPTRIQDCSHWCLPGVPDTWNELVYAQLLIKSDQHRQQILTQEQRQRRA